jgi:hypothetical protein
MSAIVRQADLAVRLLRLRRARAAGPWTTARTLREKLAQRGFFCVHVPLPRSPPSLVPSPPQIRDATAADVPYVKALYEKSDEMDFGDVRRTGGTTGASGRDAATSA